MYILTRGDSAWSCDTVEEMWSLNTIQVRLHSCFSDVRTFADFGSRLANGERLHIGPITVWRCEQCTPADKCKWHRLIKQTATEATAFERSVLDVGACIINNSGVITSPIV